MRNAFVKLLMVMTTGLLLSLSACQNSDCRWSKVASAASSQNSASDTNACGGEAAR